MNEQAEHERGEPRLVRDHWENVSLYSREEELVELMRVAERQGVRIRAILIGDEAGRGLGYLVVGDSEAEQEAIVAEAPWAMVDVDDTAVTTSANKRKFRAALEQLGVSSEIGSECDRLSRAELMPGQGSLYQPELEMRLLTAALGMAGEDPAIVKERLRLIRQELLDSPSMTEMRLVRPVDEQVRQLFEDYRYQVPWYPDTEGVLTALRSRGGAVYANVLALTYGETTFQLAKALPLMKAGLVQGVFLTKVSKGLFIEQLVRVNPLRELAITYNDPGNRGQGVRLRDWAVPVMIMDDDPGQVVSINVVASKLGIPILAVLRQRSHDHKRFSVETPDGKGVRELIRSEDGRLTGDVVRIQEETYATAIEQVIVGNFTRWLEAVVQVEMAKMSPASREVEAVVRANPRAAVIDYFRDHLDEVGWLMEAATSYVAGGSVTPEAMRETKERVVAKCMEVIKRRWGEIE